MRNSPRCGWTSQTEVLAIMGRVETADASMSVKPGRRPELQKAMKEAQFSLKWIGRDSPDRSDADVIDANLTRLPSHKADNGHRSRNSNPSVKAKEVASVRTRTQQISSREPLPETGHTNENPVKGEGNAFELFKKEFIEKLAVKAKERPGYLLANEDFAKPVKAQPKLFRETDEDSVKPVKARPTVVREVEEDFVTHVKAHSKLKQTEEDFARTVKDEPKLFKHIETLEQPSSFAGSPNSKKEILERTVKIIESSRGLLRSSSAVHQKFSDSNWMSKCDKLKLDKDKQSWSKDVEETSKEFILTKFFQTPVTQHKPSNSVYDAYITDEEATPRVYLSRRRMLSTANNASRKPENVEKYREGQDFNLGKMLGDHSARIRRDVSKPSTGSPRRRLSSEDTRKDLSRSPGRKISSEDTRKDSSRSPGRKILCEDKRNDPGSPGRRLSSEETRKDSTKSSGRRLSSEEMRKDSFQNSTRSSGGVFAAGDFRTREQGKQSNSGRTRDERSDSETQQQPVKREKDAMLKSLKMAAAVDQAHFLRALEDNGAVQSSEPLDNDTNRYSGVNNAALQKPSSPNGRKNIVIQTAFGSSMRSREPSPTGWRDASSFGSSTRSREPSPIRREGTCTMSPRRSLKVDDSSEKTPSSLHSGEIQTNSSAERSQLPPSCANSPPGSSPQLSRQSSSDENESVSGGSVIEKLMRKASLRNSSRLGENHRNWSSAPASPNHPPTQQPSSDSKTRLRRTLSFANQDVDTHEAHSESASRQTSRASSPTSCRTVRKTNIETNPPNGLPRSLSERKSSTIRATSLSEESAASAPVQQHPLSNSLRVNVPVKESTIAKLKSRSSTSPVSSDSQKHATVEESCCPIATPERTSSTVTSGGSPLSPSSDDSSSEGSSCIGVEQPSPVSVLSYNSKRTPFQEDSRLSPLEHKIQVLHERIRKSKTDVSNQKKARLEKIKATEAQLKLCVTAELDTEELFRAEESKAPKTPETPKAPNAPRAPKALQLLHLPAASDVEEKKPLALKASQLLFLPARSDALEKKKPLPSVIAAVRHEKVEKARPPAPILDFCTSLETLDLKRILPWVEEKKWDLLYIRDVLLASNFGRDKSSMTRWYSITEPMDPCLFEKLEEYYRFGKKFSGSHFLSKFAETQESYQSMQAYVQRVFFDPAASERENIDTMNRCFMFDVVNETLAKKLIPYVALPRPWMKPLAKPIVRPRPIGGELMQEIWTDIYDQIGNNGSMSMDKGQLHQSLENLVSEDWYKRTDLFPTREVERAAERVGIELERRILDDLLEETITSLWNSV